ncbi:elongator complex protein 6 [Ptiloglossa arizonensis]|uniref:elongator complex protein 6 n=1 Tax=Ptiloglossa arizonensis TaxID=3350558 RepID=UPI003F9F7222
MDSISNKLGIDMVNMDRKLILIEEQGNVNASFLLSSMIFDALKNDYGICFVLFHNTYNHYYNVCMKFGYDLKFLREDDKIQIIEPMKIIANTMQCTNEETSHNLNTPITNLSSNNNEDIIHNLFTLITRKYNEMILHKKRAIIVIDDLSHLFNLGLNLRETMYFVRYLRSLVEHNKQCQCQLYVLVHTYQCELSNYFPNIFINGLKHMAYLFIKVEPFKTGQFRDVSGLITLNWQTGCETRQFNLPQIVRYMYALSDRQVKIYTPGTLAMLV